MRGFTLPNGSPGTIGPPEPVTGVEAHTLDAVLGAIERQVSRLRADSADPPARLQIRVGEVSIAAEWVGRQPAAETGVGRVEAAPAPPPAAEEQAHHHVLAPSVGVFHRAPEPGAEPFVGEGDTVRRGQQVGIVEVMKLMIPVESDVHGEVVRILRADGEAVEFGDELIAVVPADHREQS